MVFRFQSVALAITFGLFAMRTAAQNPPMNCSPDGIVEVCTLADTTSSANVSEVVAAPALAPVAKVTYNNGELTISADNVSLQDVLHAVSAKTGARIEIPPGSGSEPVFANLGPGPARDVIAALLHGAPFNYVIAGSPNTNGNLQSIVLTQAGQSTTEVAQSAGLEGPSQGVAPAVPMQSVMQGPSVSVAGNVAAQNVQSPDQQRANFQAAIEKARATIMRNMSRGPRSEQAEPPAADSSTANSDPARSQDSATIPGPTAAPASGLAPASDSPTPQ